MTENPDIPTEHHVQTHGFDSKQDGRSECDCGWSVEDDLFGTAGLAHAWASNYPFYESLRVQLHKALEALWECARLSGADLEGDSYPVMKSPSVPEFAIRCVKDLRESYEESLDETDLILGPIGTQP